MDHPDPQGYHTETAARILRKLCEGKYDEANPTDELWDSIKRAVLLRNAAGPARTRFQINSGKYYSFEVRRRAIDEYLRARKVWTSPTHDGDAMDVSYIGKKGSKGKGNDGKVKGKRERQRRERIRIRQMRKRKTPLRWGVQSLREVSSQE